MKWLWACVVGAALFTLGWLTCFISALAATKIDWKGRLEKRGKL
jgi:hypothetical protein